MEEAHVNYTAYIAYENSKKIDQKLIDFSDIIMTGRCCCNRENFPDEWYQEICDFMSLL